MCAAFVTHPIDTIKVRLQLQQGKDQKYRGFVRGTWTIIKQEGLRGLYGGMSASLLREGSYSTIRMGLYEPFKNILRSENDRVEPFYKKLIAGGLSGMIGAAIANPTDLIKVRMQAESQPGRPAKIFDIAKDILKREGVPGLYRGVVPTTIRAMILTGSQLSSYDQSKQLLIRYGILQEGVIAHFAASMMAGVVAATCSAPVDLIKSRYMNQDFDSKGKGKLYSSTLDCLRKTARNEGVMALFKGWVPQWMRLGPHTIVTFLILEQMRRLAGMKPV
ncbi:mitochondrial carrier domain-containing protein [Gorgonomyces haynaldii]|nr:mitochondrial carrier domain-containing protein [Gorgonomyces haynaldii]